MNINIEAIRAWAKSKTLKQRRGIADKTGYPFDSLNKFAVGKTEQPRFTKLDALNSYMEKEITDEESEKSEEPV